MRKGEEGSSLGGGGGDELQRRPSSRRRGSGAGPAFQTVRVQAETARPTHACVSLSSHVGLLGRGNRGLSAAETVPGGADS